LPSSQNERALVERPMSSPPLTGGPSPRTAAHERAPQPCDPPITVAGIVLASPAARAYEGVAAGVLQKPRPVLDSQCPLPLVRRAPPRR
jgi:hypothetical protein